MDDVVTLVSYQAAQAFQKRFPAEVQRRGHLRFQEGAVESLRTLQPDSSYRAVVQDAAWKNEVSLQYDPVAGWSGSCSCPVESDCVHVFAAMSALLAEHRTALVRQLSTGQAGAAAALPSFEVKPESDDADGLRERLMAATGVPPSREALRFLSQLHQVYLRCHQSRQIGYWDLQQLGFPLASYSWTALNIWPAFPKGEYEFWLYLANYMKEQNFKIPEFMLPITDLTSIAGALSRWRRAGEIEKWKQALGNLQANPQASAPLGEVDLRLMIADEEARLQWKRPGLPDFEPLKQQQYRQLEVDYHAGRLTLTPEAELLWQWFHQLDIYGMKICLVEMEDEVASGLSSLLRIRALDSRIVDALGAPLLREAQCLRWDLLPAQTEADDYRLRLVQADGALAPPILSVLPGRPALYLTAGGLFAGPDPMTGVLDPTVENSIPAPAVERPSGVTFLQALGLDLPPRVRERVRTLEYQITIVCSLRPTYPGSDVDECLVSVQADAADGHQQTWTGAHWVARKPKGSGKKTKSDGVITRVRHHPLGASVSFGSDVES
jgi:hypothetical protein